MKKQNEYRFYLIVIQDEIAWCKAHPDTELTKQEQQMFIKGLKQAQFLIRKSHAEIVKAGYKY